MKRLLIIARREYLSYVATWGFWISLGMVPLFMTLGFGLPALMERSAPERLFAVVSEEQRVVDAIDAVFAERRAANTGDALAALAGAEGGPDAAAAVRQALERGASLEEAARAGGVSEAAAAMVEQQTRRQYVRIPAPAETEEGLRPYLTGEAALPGQRPGAPLYAAIFVRRGAAGYEIDYWSANLTNPALRSAAVEAVRRVMRNDALEAAGVDPAIVERAAAARPLVRDFSPEKEEGAEEVTFSDRLPYILGVGAGFVLWSVIFSVANMLLTSTIEEKSGKVLEVLLSSARLPEILAGKLLGVAGVSFTLLAVWFGAAAGVAGLIGAAAPEAAGPAAEVVGAALSLEMLVPFVFYFVVGYLIYGAIFMAIGSLCETMQEAQTLMSPLVLVLMAPMLLLVFSMSNPDSALISGAVWMPLFTPFLMMARLPQDPSLGTVLGTSALMLATLAFVIWLGSRVFRAGALGQAKPGSLMKAFRKA